MGFSDDPADIAADLALTASDRDPREEKIGIVMADQSAGAGAIYSALWFGTHDEVADFLRRSFRFLASSADYAVRIDRIAQRVVAEGLDQQALQELNRCAVRPISLLWTGSFEQLCHADGEIPRLLVSMFRNGPGEGGRIRPINKAETSAFAEFLADMKDPD